MSLHSYTVTFDYPDSRFFYRLDNVELIQVMNFVLQYSQRFNEVKIKRIDAVANEVAKNVLKARN